MLCKKRAANCTKKLNLFFFALHCQHIFQCFIKIQQQFLVTFPKSLKLAGYLKLFRAKMNGLKSRNFESTWASFQENFRLNLKKIVQILSYDMLLCIDQDLKTLKMARLFLAFVLSKSFVVILSFYN